MSVATQIERLQGVRDQIRTKMVALGLSENTDLLQNLADDLDGVDKITPTSSTKDPGTSYTNTTLDRSTSTRYVKIPKGYNGANTKFTVSGVPDGAYSASVSSHTTTNATASSSVSGTITGITTTTAPTSGTDGTDYYTITPKLATGAGKSKVKAKATISTAGYIAAGSSETSEASKDVSVSATQGSNYYLPASTFGSETTTDPTSSTNLKSVTAGTAAKYIPINAGYRSAGKITVNPTPSESKTFTPTKAGDTVTPFEGKLLSKVVVAGVPSISVTLSSGSWSSDSNTTIGKYYYNVSNSNITASNDLFAMPGSPSTAQSFGTYLYSQSAGSMQFRSVAQPTSNLTYTVYYMS